MMIKLNNSNNSKGALVLVFSGLCFSVCNLLLQYPYFIKMQIPTSITTFYQYLFALIFLLPYILKIGVFSALKTKNLLLHIIRVFFAVLGVHFFTMALIKGVPINQVIGLITTSTIFVVIGSNYILKEKVNSVRWIATLLGCIGGFIILQPWSNQFTYFALLPILAAICWAIYSVIVKKISSTDSPLTVIAYLFILTTPFNLVKALPDFEYLTLNINSFLYLLMLGGFTALAQYGIAKAYNLADASYIQPFDHIKILFNIFFGWYLLSQVPSKFFWIGMILILLAITAISIAGKNKNSALNDN